MPCRHAGFSWQWAGVGSGVGGAWLGGAECEALPFCLRLFRHSQTHVHAAMAAGRARPGHLWRWQAAQATLRLGPQPGAAHRGRAGPRRRWQPPCWQHHDGSSRKGRASTGCGRGSRGSASSARAGQGAILCGLWRAGRCGAPQAVQPVQGRVVLRADMPAGEVGGRPLCRVRAAAAVGSRAGGAGPGSHVVRPFEAAGCRCAATRGAAVADGARGHTACCPAAGGASCKCVVRLVPFMPARACPERPSPLYALLACCVPCRHLRLFNTVYA